MSEQIQTTPIDAAIAELERELQVRQRCYPRWVKEGKQLTQFEATERYNRLAAAIGFLKVLEARQIATSAPTLEVLPAVNG